MRSLILALAAAPLVFSQTQAEFEVASVKPSAPLTDAGLNVGVHIDGAMIRCTYVSLLTYMSVAYDVKEYQIVAPEWLSAEHFDVVGKLPEGPRSDKSLRDMIASLLQERFALKMHRETRELPAYALVVGKNGLKMKELPPDDSADTGKVDVNVTGGGRGGTVVDLGGGSSLSYSLNKLEAKKVTIPSIIDSLAKFLHRPVIDKTELTGRYNFTLDYSIEELKNLVRASGADASHIPDMGGDQVSIFTSVEDLGLKLEARKEPMPVVVVDSIQKTPTAN